MRKISSYLILTICLLLQACTIARYDLSNQLITPSSLIEGDETITYHLEFNGKPKQLTRNAHYTPTQIEAKRHAYAKSTQKVFDQEQVIATETQTKAEASFLIDINSTPYLSALPQEWLTGLSLGLIPSWGTRTNEYSYTFEKVGVKSEHTYTVDSKSFNHLVCFPIFWTMFFTLDESKVYEKSLENYLRKK